MEAPDCNLDSSAAKLSCNIERPRKLVGLNADQHHHADIRCLDRTCQVLDPHLPVGLVNRFDVNVEVGAKDLALATIQRDAVKAGQRIRWEAATPPSDHVTIIA